jgi:hypothetical protein
LWIAPTWTSVVGTRGFDHTHNNPDYDAYLRSIQEVGDSAAAAAKSIQFEPKVIGWKDQQR